LLAESNLKLLIEANKNSFSRFIWQDLGVKHYIRKGVLIMTTKSKIRVKEKLEVKDKSERKVADTEVKKTESLLPGLRHEIEDTVTRILEGWPRFGASWHWPELDTIGKIDLPKRLANIRNLPRVDFSEIDDGYELTAELPGMGDEDVECTLSGNILTVKGEKQEEKEEQKKGYYLRERHYGSFMRNFTLPEDVDAGKIEALVADGVLRVFMPKSEQKQKSRKIEVKKS
jgi:HSP20 family protein